MPELTITDQTANRPSFGLRRVAALSAIVAFGLLAPTAAGAETPPAPDGGPGGVITAPGQPECDPRLASCDLTNLEPEPECDPRLASCDLTNPEPGDPGDDGEPGEPGTPGEQPPADIAPSADPQALPTAQVDAPVRATPNYTG